MARVFGGSPIKSVQRGVYSAFTQTPYGNAVDVAVSSVNMGKALLGCSFRNGVGSNSTYTSIAGGGYLKNETTINLNTGVGGGNSNSVTQPYIYWELIEYV